jgi:hypothetical protein
MPYGKLLSFADFAVFELAQPCVFPQCQAIAGKKEFHPYEPKGSE